MSETNNEVNTENKEPKSNKTTLLIILILLLVGTNIYLYIKLNSKQEVVNEMTEQAGMDSLRYADLDMKYTSALTDIESLKGQNTSLDSVLTIKENQIKTMKAALDAAKKKGILTKKEYEEKFSALQELVDELKNQITSLEKEKNILIAQKDSLGNDLNTKIGENTVLKKENRVYRTEAGLLKTQNIIGSGVYAKKNGKEVATNKAKGSEKLKVCFDVDESKTSDAGSKTFYLRVISPEGVTLAVQSQGSGVLTMAKTDEQVQYTTTKSIEYNQQKQNVCIYWQQNTPFPKGKYTAEVYQDGYKIGSKDFTLK